MAEVIDDTETFTIALTPPPCPTPSAIITLVSQDGLTVTVNVQMSPGAGATWKSYNPLIDWGDNAQTNTPANGHHTHTYAAPGTYSIGVYGCNTCGKSKSAVVLATVNAPVIPAKCEIVSLNYPASVQHGALYDIHAMAKNIGGSSGTFKMQLLINGAVKSTSAQFTLAAGATSTDKIPAATAPMTGTSMSFAVECIRIT